MNELFEEFIAPAFGVDIGDYSLRHALSIDVYSRRDAPMDTATIVIDTRLVDRAPLIERAPVSIRLGYLEKGLWDVFNGEIGAVSWRAEGVVSLKGKAETLRRTSICQTFIDAAPQEIIAHALRQAGVTKWVLGSSELPARHHFVAQNLTVIELVRLVNRSWGLDWPWFCDADGTFYWCPWQETGRDQLQPYILEYGRNLFDLTPPGADGRGRLESIMLPFLKHSHKIRIQDPRFWQAAVTARIERVHHHIDGRRGRTSLIWTLV